MKKPTQFDREDRLFDLANRACGCCGLTPTEEKELAEILSSSSYAREIWTAFWQMESSLEMNRDILSALADHPDNVLTMPGAGTGLASAIEDVRGEATRSAFVFDFWKCATVAALVVLAIGVWKLEGPSPTASNQSAGPVSPTPEFTLAPEKSKPGIIAVDGNAPDEEYQEQLATASALDNDSVSRPNVNINAVTEVESSIVPKGEKLSFNKHVRPILSDNCFSCHGPDEEGRKAKLRLDTEEGAKANVIVAGDICASELVTRITSSDPDEVMPTPDSHKKLTQPQIELLKRWVAEGAEYEGHWAFEPHVHSLEKFHEVPDAELRENEIDVFVETSLKQ